MLESFRTVYEGGSGQIVEKKSRFIATVRPVSSQEDFLSFLEETRKKYWDARHNCYACTAGLNREYTRSSDDGEPPQTAGRPMLDVILGEELYNCAVVVTRYFGGVLLGTGGLVRAYSKAVQEGLKNSRIIEKQHGMLLRVESDYTDYGKLSYLFQESGYPIIASDFAEKVRLKVLTPASREASCIKAVTSATSARSLPGRERELYYASDGGEVLLFDLNGEEILPEE